MRSYYISAESYHVMAEWVTDLVRHCTLPENKRQVVDINDILWDVIFERILDCGMVNLYNGRLNDAFNVNYNSIWNGILIWDHTRDVVGSVTQSDKCWLVIVRYRVQLPRRLDVVVFEQGTWRQFLPLGFRLAAELWSRLAHNNVWITAKAFPWQLDKKRHILCIFVLNKKQLYWRIVF